jgi:hypothetical protein
LFYAYGAEKLVEPKPLDEVALDAVNLEFVCDCFSFDYSELVPTSSPFRVPPKLEEFVEGDPWLDTGASFVRRGSCYFQNGLGMLASQQPRYKAKNQ